MMQVNHLKQGYIRLVFASFCVLVALDVALLFCAEEYRDFFGVTRGVADVMWRIVPDVTMMFFYGLAYLKMKSVGLLPRVALWHGLIFGLLGLVLCLPWGGYFFAPFTPIGSLYLAAILWLPDGYLFSLSVAVVFIAFNVSLMLQGIAQGRIKST